MIIFAEFCWFLKKSLNFLKIYLTYFQFEIFLDMNILSWKFII